MQEIKDSSCQTLGLMTASEIMGASYMLEMYHDEVTRSIKTYSKLIGENDNMQDLEALFIEALTTFKHALYAVSACNETIKKNGLLYMQRGAHTLHTLSKKALIGLVSTIGGT